MVITAFNPATEELEKTYLANSTAAGVTTFLVKNNDRFAQNDRIMAGEMGREKTEVISVGGAVVDGTSLTVSATVFTHEADDPIYQLRFDQVKFYRSTTGISGSYSVIATVDMDVDNAELITAYDDTTGLATYYYKVSYYNSISTLESAQSDAFLGAGYPRGSAGFLIDELMTEFKDYNELIVKRRELLGWLNEVNDDLMTRSRKPYDFLRTRTVLTRTANTSYVDWPTDSGGNQIMWKFDRLDYNFTDSATTPVTDITYTLRVISTEEFRNTYVDNTISSTTVNDQTAIMSIDTAMKRFRFWPPFKTTSAAAMYLYYWKYFNEINSEGDILETPNPRIYKLYCLHKFFRLKGTTDASFLQISDRYLQDYNTEVAKLQRANSRDAGTPEAFKFLPQNYRGNRGTGRPGVARYIDNGDY